ncbi:MAG: flagellar motor switch protein FliM [Phycisphaeraceae bacterium]|nr:MAG: flagellar motor switch protein FliM [Phycisphaeraceae bacterium]
MADVLDQGDVDALLAAVESGDIEQEDTAGLIFSRSRADVSSIEVRAYDFKRPERVSKDQMRALQTLHEAFARNFGAALSGFLRAIVEVRVATCEQMTYGDFISGLPNPTSFNLISADALQGQMCLEISPLIIYPIIDRLLGGTSQELFIPQRPMTLIETRLIENVTRRGLAALSEAWESVRKLKFAITAAESNPQLVQIVPPNEVVVVVGLEMKLSNRAGTMNLCIPYNVIEPVMADLSTQNWFSVGADESVHLSQERMEGSLERATVGVSGVLAETTITFRDLAGLRAGDLITTDKSAASPVVLCVEGKKKYLGRLGRCRRNRAIEIIRAIEPSDRF